MSQLSDQQLSYLRSMGIDYWVPRQDLTGQVTATITLPVNDSDGSVSTRAGFDVDWQALQQQVKACQRCDLRAARVDIYTVQVVFEDERRYSLPESLQPVVYILSCDCGQAGQGEISDCE